MTQWQWESIRDDAAIDIGDVVDRHVGGKLSMAEKFKLTHELLDVADRLSQENARRKIDDSSDALRRTIGRFNLKLPRARRKMEDTQAEREIPY